MNTQTLRNIWNKLSNDGLVNSDFDTWKNNFLTNPEVPGNVYRYLRENGLVNSSPDEWVKNISTPTPVEDIPSVSTDLPEVDAAPTDQTSQPRVNVPTQIGKAPELTAKELASYKDPEVDKRVEKEKIKGVEFAKLYNRRKNIEDKTGLWENQYPQLQTGTEIKKEGYPGYAPGFAPIEVPTYEQADEDKMEEIIADASAEYKNIFESMLSNDFKMLLSMANPENFKDEYEAEFEKYHDKVYSKLKGKYPGLDRFSFNKIVGYKRGTTGHQKGLFSTALQETASKVGETNNNTNLAGANKLDGGFEMWIHDILESKISPKEVEKKKLVKSIRDKYNRLTELKEKDPESTEITTLIAEIETDREDWKKLATYTRTTTGGKFEEINPLLASERFNLETGASKYRQQKIAEAKKNYRPNASSDVASKKQSNPKLTDFEAHELVFKAEAFNLQQLHVAGREEQVNLKFNAGTAPDLFKQLRERNLIPADRFNEEGILISNDLDLNVPVKSVFDAGYDGRDFTGKSNKWGYNVKISDEDMLKLVSYEDAVTRTMGKLEYLHETTYVNNDPETFDRGGTLGELARGTITNILTHFTDISYDEADEIASLGPGKTHAAMLNEFEKFVPKYNEMLSDEIAAGEIDELGFTENDMAAIERTFGESVGEGFGHFAPMLIELGIISAGTGAILSAPKIAKALSVLRTGNGWKQAQYYAIMAMIEEGKMYTAGFTPGTGAAFYAGGQLTAGFTPFKRRWKYLDPFFQKVIKGGPVGMMSSQAATVVSSAVEDLRGNADFQRTMEEHFGNLTFKDLAVEAIVFSIAGAMHAKKTDFMSTRGKYDAITELQKEINIERENPKGKKKEVANEYVVISPEGKKMILTPEQWMGLDTQVGWKIEQKPGDLKRTLSPEQQSRVETLSEAKRVLTKMAEMETTAIELDPNHKDFEVNVRKKYMDPVNATMKSLYKGFEGFKIEWTENSNDPRLGRGSEWGPAKYLDPKGKGEAGTILFLKRAFSPERLIHEISHVGLESYFRRNEQVLEQFTGKIAKLFEKFDFKAYDGTPLGEYIDKAYSTEIAEQGPTVKPREFLAHMFELLTDPKIYYQIVAPNFFKESKQELLSIMEESFGIKPKIRTVEQFVDFVGRLSIDARRGLGFQAKMARLADLDEITFEGIEFVENNKRKLKENTERGFFGSSKDLGKQKKVFLENQRESKLEDADGRKRETPLYSVDKYLFTEDGIRKYDTVKEFMKSDDFYGAYEKLLGPNGVFDNAKGDPKSGKGGILYGIGGKGHASIPSEQHGAFVKDVKEKLMKRLTETFNPKEGGGSLYGYFLNHAIPWEKTRVQTEYIESKKTGKKGGIPIDKTTEEGVGMQLEAPADPMMKKLETEIIIPGRKKLEKKEGPQQYVDMIKDSFKTEKEKEKYTKDIDKAVVEADINIDVEKPTYKGVKKEVVGVEKITRIDKKTGKVVIDKKTGKPKLFAPTKEADVTPAGRLPKVLEIIADKYGIPLKRMLATQTLTDPMRTKARNRILQTINSWKRSLPDGETISGTATGIANTSWAFLYNFPGGRGSFAEGKTAAGKAPVTRRKDITTQEILDAVGIDANGNFLSGTKYDSAIKEYIKLEAQWTAVQSMMKTGKGRFTQAALAETGSGRNESLSSKMLKEFSETFGIEPEKTQDIFIQYAVGARSLIDKKHLKFLDRFKDHEFFNNPRAAAYWSAIEVEGLKGKTTETKWNVEFNNYWDNFKGELPDGITIKDMKKIQAKAFYTTSEKKFYTFVDVLRLNKHVDLSVEFAKMLPKGFEKSLTFFDQLVGLHQRVTQEKEGRYAKFAEKYKAISPEGKKKSFTEEKWEETDTTGWKIIEKPGDLQGFILDSRDGSTIIEQPFTRGRERALKNIGENVSEVWEGIEIKFKSASTQEAGQRKIAEAGGNIKKQLEIAEKHFSELDNKTKEDIYFAIEATKQEFIEAGKNKQEKLDRMEWMYNVARSNTDMRLGSRQLVPVKYVLFPEGRITGEKIKLEHLKAMVTQSIQTANLVAAGKFKEAGKEATSDFLGITSRKDLLDIVDVNGGLTNTSGLYRMALLHPEILKQYKSVDSGFKRTLLQDILLKFEKEVGSKKFKELQKNHKTIDKNLTKELKKVGLSSKGLSRGEKEKAIKDVDKAMANGRKRKKKARGMSTWDFDDTLAKTKSGVGYRLPNPNYKPGTGNWYDFAYKLRIPWENTAKKVIFMAGPPGSGKSNVIKQLNLKGIGMQKVAADVSLEKLIKKAGLPADMKSYTPEQTKKFGELTLEAGAKAGKVERGYQREGVGVVVDGTGARRAGLEWQVKNFQKMGYDVGMVFVEASEGVAIARNKARKERSLSKSIVANTRKRVMENKEAYRKLFGKNFAEVKTDNLKQGEQMPNSLTDVLYRFIAKDSKGRLSASEYADRYVTLKNKGAKFDFSEFDRVVRGEKGPLFGKAMDRAKKFGTKNQFILTARPHAAKESIYEFLKSQGLKIPLENIITLENSTAEAKAMWMLKKFSEGYNDIYFADDAMQNVKAVKHVLGQLDIKSKVQQALSSKDLGKEVNDIMEHSLGIESKKRFSTAEGKVRGKDKKRRKFFIPDSAADLELLIEPLLGKGKKGIENRKWFVENFHKPFERGINDLNNARQTILNDYYALRKQNKDVVKSLDKPVEGTNFTVDQAARVYIWNKAGFEVPGLTKTSKAKLLEHIANNPKLKAFAENVAILTKIETGLKKPSEYWWGETLATEVSETGRTIDREKYIGDWIEAKKEIFSEENLAKMESELGPRWREAMDGMLYRMESGRMRAENLDRLSNEVMDYLNGATGAIMHLNTRSATLQLISTVNFINHGENNPFAAAKAFANQPQYWKDFMFIMNSPMLKQRRAGLQINVSEAELVAAARSGKKGVYETSKRILATILKHGYLPTKIADSFAIASGGATYYRNRIKMYERQGLKTKEAERKAWIDFQAIAEKTQQSSRPDLLSQQQVTIAGRLVLPFGNTPMQMNRIGMKELLDISKGRYKGFYGENSLTHKMSKISYYWAIQSAIFAGLQSAAFAVWSMSDDEELKAQKKIRAANTMADSFLRGMGLSGAVLAGFKNAVFKFAEQNKKGYRGDFGEVGEALLNISPTIGSKFSGTDAAGNTYKYNKKDIQEEGISLSNTSGIEATAQTIQSITNAPTYNYFKKNRNIQGALDEQNAMWQRMHMFMGWSPYDVGAADYQKKKKKKKKKEIGFKPEVYKPEIYNP